MEVEFIHIDVDINYPVGAYIDYNVPHINRMMKALELRFPTVPITFWVTGSSGSIISGIIAANIKNPSKIIYVSKQGENNHQTDEHPEPMHGGVNVIVDDFVRSGDTLRRILYFMRQSNRTVDCLCVGESVYGHTLKEITNSFPVIIGSRIYLPSMMSITESSKIDLDALCREARIKNEMDVNY